MSKFTGKISQAVTGRLAPGRFLSPQPVISNYGSIKTRSFNLEKNIDFIFKLEKSAE